jgi:hypothetical protein
MRISLTLIKDYNDDVRDALIKTKRDNKLRCCNYLKAALLAPFMIHFSHDPRHSPIHHSQVIATLK